jgi:hypothetical protein
MYIRPDGTVGGGLPPFDKDKFEKQFGNKDMINEDTQIGIKSMPFTYTKLGSSIGFATGVGYAFYKKTGFWKGWGIAIIGSIVLGGVAYGIDVMNYNKK